MDAGTFQCQESTEPANGWISSMPLDHYSSLHELSLPGLLGWKTGWPNHQFFVHFNFNLHTPCLPHPKASFTFHTRDAQHPPLLPHCSFSITELQRWRLNIAPHPSFEHYLDGLIRWHRCSYLKSEKAFKYYGCTTHLFEEDWTPHVDTVYSLYKKVAQKHGDQLYQRSFFEAAAKREDYKLLSAWFEGNMIGMFLLQDEQPTLHSTCCGFDYFHSSKSCAYSWLHYVLIQSAIESGKYQDLDIGMTADSSKRSIGFKPIPARMDVYAKGTLQHAFLKAASYCVKATITPDAKLKIFL